MVYKEAARKTFGFMVLSAVLSIGILSIITLPQTTPVAHVTEDITLGGGFSSIAFAVGVFIGALVIGTYVYIAKIEGRS